MDYAMTLKTLNKYAKYSGVWVGFAINPYHWTVRYEQLHPDDLNPNMRGVYISVGPIWVRLILDDGAW